MENIKVYAVLSKKHDVISNVFLSNSDAQAGTFMLQQLDSIYKEVPDKLKLNFLEDVRNNAVVKIGEISPESKQMINDYNCILDLFDYRVGEEQTNSKGGVSDEQTKE